MKSNKGPGFYYIAFVSRYDSLSFRSSDIIETKNIKLPKFNEQDIEFALYLTSTIEYGEWEQYVLKQLLKNLINMILIY